MWKAVEYPALDAKTDLKVKQLAEKATPAMQKCKDSKALDAAMKQLPGADDD